MTMLFNLKGNPIMTAGVAELLERGVISYRDVAKMFARHLMNNDDNTYAEDRTYNQEAIDTKTGRVLSVYNVKGYKFYVNTYMEDWVEEPTIIMLAEEY